MAAPTTSREPERSLKASISSNSSIEEKAASSNESQSTASAPSRRTSEDDVTEFEVGKEPEQWKEQSQESFHATFDKNIRSSESILASDNQSSSTSSESLTPDNDDITDEHVRKMKSIRSKLLENIERNKANPFRELDSTERHMMTGVEYLDRTLGRVLSQGLSQIIKKKPSNPAEFLAAYLLADQARIDDLENGISAPADQKSTDEENDG